MLNLIITWCAAFLAGYAISQEIYKNEQDWLIFTVLFHVVILVGAIGAFIYRTYGT